MTNIVGKVKQWWQGGSPNGVPFGRLYAVTCDCGRVVEGRRQKTHHSVRCPGCGHSVFVLGYSPLAALSTSLSERAVPVPGATPPKTYTWSMPWMRNVVLAGLATLAVVIFIYAAILSLYVAKPTARSSQSATPEQLLSDARKAIQDRDYNLALEKLRTLRTRQKEDQDSFKRSQRREVLQLLRQTEALSTRVTDRLDEMVRSWAELKPDQVERLFTDYQNRPIFLDLVVTRDGPDRYTKIEPRFGKPLPQLQLTYVQLLRELPLGNMPQRLLFAANLANIQRDPQQPRDPQLPQQWIVKFVPNSGCLVTEEGVAKILGITVDEELRHTLAKQQEWLDGLPEDRLEVP